jgi:putative ABC transport system permease protein
MVLHEFRLAVRALARAPRITATVVVTLAVAVGGAGGLFGLLNAVVLRQLPVPEPERLVSVYPANGEAMLGIPGATLDELSRQQTVFEGVCGFSRGSAWVDAGSGVIRRPHEGVGAACGRLLSVRTVLGRFVDESDRADSMQAAAVVVLSHSYWTSGFSADPAVLGRTLRMQGMPLTIVGVMAPNAYGMNADQPPDVVVPLGLSPRLFGGPRVIAINAFGRLTRGATLESARSELSSLWPAVWDATNPPVPGRAPSAARSPDALVMQPFGGGLSELRTRYTDSLYVLLGLAALLLALSVVNVGGVLLARGIERQQQMAIQLSLGAGVARLTMQLAIEGLLLAMTAAIVSVPIAWWSSQALAHSMWTATLPLTMRVVPDATTLAAIAAVTFAIGVLVNLPAVRLIRTGSSLVQASGSRTAFAATSWWRQSLTVSQVALSVVLICTAALFGRSLASLRGTEVGFLRGGLRAIALDALPGVPRDIDQAAYLAELEQRLMAVPGVSDVTYAGRFPLSAVREVTSLLPNYRNAASPIGSEIPVSTEHVAPDFFQMIGTPLLQGRAFTLEDRPGRPGVAIINTAMAARLFPGGDAVGGQIKGVVASQPLTVVGVVGNATRGDPRISSAPTVYLPGLQETARFQQPMVIVRADARPDLAAAMQAAVASMGRHNVSFIRSIDEQMDRHLARERVLSYLSAAAASLGLVVAALGLFGLLAYAVSSRTREMGLRMALGGSGETLARMIVREGMLLVAIGAAFGVVAAYAAGRLASALLYNVAPADPVSLAGAVALMAAVGLIACAIPALRVVGLSPADALRQD